MRPFPLLLVLLASASLSAADVTPPKGETPPPATDLLGNPTDVPTVSKEEAAVLVVQGKEAMIESNDNPRRSVDAAVAFSKALKYYETTGDTDTICDLEANIFWCKKRMNLDDVKSFVAQKSGDKTVVAALAKVDKVANKEVTADKADEYFSRAEKFASKNPENFEQISVRYFEVAERFVGTEVGIKAQKLSLVAQQNQMKAIKEAQDAQRETLFSKPTKLNGKIQQTAVPSTDTQKSSASSIRTLYKSDFAKRKPNQKQNLLNKLMDQARTTKDDPVMLHALLTAATDLAMECQDFYAVISASDLMAMNFSGVDATAQKKTAFGKSKNPTVLAIIKLLDNPEDGDANTIVGKYFCYEAQKWDLGIPLLMHGTDADMKSLGDMEQLKPDGVAQQIELGDKWYDIGKKGRKGQPTLEGPMGRALYWYQLAEPKITGISKDRIAKRMDEIDSLLPMTNLNYESLTAKQWDRLKGGMAVISAAKDRNDIGLRLTAGKKYRIVPHPTDTWQPTTYYSSGNSRSVNWKGESLTNTPNTRQFIYFTGGDFKEGAMVMQIENGKWMKPGLVEGDGRLWLGPFSDYAWGAGGKGEIRIKILPADDE
ncbi:MAG: hypothetical protein H0W78_16750 [Planctomycetes bacterium]|nr:hypothetical protein [Planctomycetota bacterium]